MIAIKLYSFFSLLLLYVSCVIFSTQIHSFLSFMATCVYFFIINLYTWYDIFSFYIGLYGHKLLAIQFYYRDFPDMASFGNVRSLQALLLIHFTARWTMWMMPKAISILVCVILQITTQLGFISSLTQVLNNPTSMHS